MPTDPAVHPFVFVFDHRLVKSTRTNRELKPSSSFHLSNTHAVSNLRVVSSVYTYFAAGWERVSVVSTAFPGAGAPSRLCPHRQTRSKKCNNQVLEKMSDIFACSVRTISARMSYLWMPKSLSQRSDVGRGVPRDHGSVLRINWGLHPEDPCLTRF